MANTEQLIKQAGFRDKFGGYDLGAKDSCKGDLACEARQAAGSVGQESAKSAGQDQVEFDLGQ